MTDAVLSVRDFLSRDIDDVRRICRETCSDPFLLENEDVLYAKYADYYMFEEPEHICILADENGRAQGYVICSADPEKYRRCWKETYMDKIKGHGPVCTLFQLHTLLETRYMAKKGFPAHLHIDISPAFQHCGGGTMLVDALRRNLSAEGIPGVYLGCAEANTVGMNFYRKYGFRVSHRYAGRTVFTIRTDIF